MKIAAAQQSLYQQSEIEAHIQSIEPQLALPQPTSVIVKEGLKSLRVILEGVAASCLATGVTSKLGQLLPMLIEQIQRIIEGV